MSNVRVPRFTPFRSPRSDQVLPARRLPCRCSCRTRPCGGPLRPRAEEVGFEPTVPMRHNGFRDRPIRPLSHSSGRDPSRSDLVRKVEEAPPGGSPARRTRSEGRSPAWPGRGSRAASQARGRWRNRPVRPLGRTIETTSARAAESVPPPFGPGPDQLFPSEARLGPEEFPKPSVRFSAKKEDTRAPHSSARTPPLTSSSWLSRGSAQRL
jgi:hypothetical protein